MMTRKDFRTIADTLNQWLDAKRIEGHLPGNLQAQHNQHCNVLANALAQLNPRFDRDRFLAACGATK